MNQRRKSLVDLETAPTGAELASSYLKNCPPYVNQIVRYVPAAVQMRAHCAAIITHVHDATEEQEELGLVNLVVFSPMGEPGAVQKIRRCDSYEVKRGHWYPLDPSAPSFLCPVGYEPSETAKAAGGHEVERRSRAAH